MVSYVPQGAERRHSSVLTFVGAARKNCVGSLYRAASKETMDYYKSRGYSSGPEFAYACPRVFPL
jgi:hypothetical protein